MWRRSFCVWECMMVYEDTGRLISPPRSYEGLQSKQLCKSGRIESLQLLTEKTDTSSCDSAEEHELKKPEVKSLAPAGPDGSSRDSAEEHELRKPEVKSLAPAGLEDLDHFRLRLNPQLKSAARILNRHYHTCTCRDSV
ncbi:unnamed protein product [Leuciscus chuanchicus]